jgi:methionine-R-sulfoxide reductase
MRYYVSYTQRPVNETLKNQLVRSVEFDPLGTRTGLVEVEKIDMPLAEWKKQLTAEQFEVTRRAGTERPFTGAYANNHADGLYHCICCNTVLFDSKTKFESGTGWPSFWAPIAKENISDRADNSLGCKETRCFADGAMPIWDMSSTMGRLPRTCAIA